LSRENIQINEMVSLKHLAIGFILTSCWNQRAKDRPSFKEIHKEIDTLWQHISHDTLLPDTDIVPNQQLSSSTPINSYYND
jgi:hypothetical protein